MLSQRSTKSSKAIKLNIRKRLGQELRSSHAGETGAVWIYKGILAIARDQSVRAFSQHHLQTEQTHLDKFDQRRDLFRPSWLLPAWRIAGFLTGFLPALFGKNAVYKTIEAVETFVDKHYQSQINWVSEFPEFQDVKQLMLACQADEIAHRNEAASLAHTRETTAIKCWQTMVEKGSSLAVRLAKFI